MADQLTLNQILVGFTAVSAFGGVGVVVARRQPHNPVGWILIGLVILLGLRVVGEFYAVLYYRLGHTGLPFAPAAVVLINTVWLPAFALPPLAIVLLLGFDLPIVGAAALPVSIAIAIMKYRLYDIDRIISRTVAYTILTGLLVGVYAGLVLLTTKVLTIKSPVAVAGSTLVAAALFTPLRSRVQRAVDRRFNRARYDADETVATLAAQLKDAMDLDAVQTDLANVVQQALEPAHVSVWMNTIWMKPD